MTSNYDASQGELRDSRNTIMQMEINIQKVQAELTEASTFKDMYNRVLADFDSEQKSFFARISEKEEEIVKIQTTVMNKDTEIAELTEKLNSL